MDSAPDVVVRTVSSGMGVMAACKGAVSQNELIEARHMLRELQGLERVRGPETRLPHMPPRGSKLAPASQDLA
jgi:hypothetical protein